MQNTSSAPSKAADSFLDCRRHAFAFAIEQTQKQAQSQNGIGTLNEKTIHAVLKNFYAPYALHQEIKAAGYVADIIIDQKIIEIQTRNFQSLRKKLEAFLPLYDVTIVYPIAKVKWLCWINEETGEVTARRRSPKKGSIYQIILELYKIKDYLSHPNLHFILPMLEVEEYRLLNGWSHDKKRGSTRHDGFPLQLLDELYIHQLADYFQLLPEGLPPIFTSKDYARLAHLSTRYAVTGLNILNHLEIVKRVGKKGNAFLYEKNEKIMSL